MRASLRLRDIEIARLRENADRYQFLRDSDNAYPLFFIVQRDPHGIVVQFRGQLADANIDEMRSGVEQAHRADCPGCALCVTYTPSPVAPRDDLETSPDGRLLK